MRKIPLLVSALLLSLFLQPFVLPRAFAAAPPNLILNPSVETANPSNANLPQNWNQGNWGTNTATFSYLQTGEDGARSVQIGLSNYTDGDAKWYFDPVTVSASTEYTFSDYYESNVTTYLVAQTTDAQGNITYQDLATVAPAAKWENEVVNFTTTSSAQTVTIFHLISANGTLTTDNFSLGLYTPPPPNQNIVPNNSVETPSAASTNLPQDWTTNSWGKNNAAFSYLNTGHTGNKSIEITMTSYTSGDAKWVYTTQPAAPKAKYQVSDFYQANVPTQVDAAVTLTNGTVKYIDIGTATPSTTGWNEFQGSITLPAKTVSFSIVHILYSAGYLITDDYAVYTETSPLTVSISSPTNEADVTGPITLSAQASGGLSPLESVQFFSDGVPISGQLTTAPYTYNWDSSTASNGTHVVTAVVQDSSETMATSPPVTIVVSNANPSDGQNIPNNQLITPDPANSQSPQDWRSLSYGTNTTAFQYVPAGHGSSKAVEIKMGGYSSGSASWYFVPQNVTPGQNYVFTDYYESNVDTGIQIEEDLTNGEAEYMSLGYASPSATWKEFQAKFSVQNNVKTIEIYHYIAANGYLNTSDFSMQPYTPVGFNRGLVSLTFDDGYLNQYTNVLPLLQQYNMTGTFYIITSEIGQPDYMDQEQIQAMLSAGNEIGSHTVTHPDLTTLTETQLQFELAESQQELQDMFNITVDDVASPFGIYDNNVIAQMDEYYKVHRSVDIGFNSEDNFSTNDIRVQNIDSTTDISTIDAWIDQANAQKTWLVLVFHGVDTSGDQYNTTPQIFEESLQHLQSLGMTGESIDQALQEVTPQL